MAKILIVDDQKAHRDLLKSILRKAGHTICAEAKNGEEALKAFIKHSPDITTMDLYMPKNDGLKGIQAIYTEDPDANIIVTTAANENKQLMQTIKSIVTAYIQKPFDETEILKAVDKALTRE